MDATVWDATVFSKNRERLLGGDIAQRFLGEVVSQAQERGLASDEHFSVDGTLIEAWASQKSFRPKDGPGGGSGSFRGQQRRNDTHASTTDPDARLYRKGHSQDAKLSYMGHVVIENRNALVMACELSVASGYAEREAAARLLERTPRGRRATVGADKAYDTRDFIASVRALGFTPHVAQNTSKRRSAIDRRTTCRAGYAASQVMRKLVEHPFGWIKSVAGLWQVKHRGQAKVGWNFALAIAAYNLTRMRTLVQAPA
jgi:hypothetical protein